ncbi:MAG TPA: sulfotransferase [Anaerolineales bacterium]|nr:sulfotransferase [Anaerolineales bacterium]
MNSLSNLPILVSGAHRSGTTWVGKMLAAGPQVAYISEPLNVWHRPGVMRVPTRRWYTYICEDNQDEYLAALQEMLSFNYHTQLEISAIKSSKDLLRLVRDKKTFWNGHRKSQLPLIKDPFAIFSSEWFSSCLGCRIVIVVRHPAAVASSLMRLGWNFDFSDLLDQSLLMRDWLKPYKDEMDLMLESADDLIAQSCLLWRMVYQSVDDLRKRLPELIVIRHEDLSADPQGRFEQLYRELDLEYTPKVQATIKAGSSEKNPKRTSPRGVHSVRIDSQSIIKFWQQHLPDAEIERVQQLTRDVAPLYYSAEDWQ